MQELIFSPQEAAKLAIDAIEDLKKHKGIGVKTGIGSLDSVLLPLRPAELLVVMGYTSWYKSGFMNWLLKSAVAQCTSTEVAVKVTWEDSVEEDTLKWISSQSGISISTLVRGEIVDWDVVMNAYTARVETPLWIVGHSNAQSSVEGKPRPRMTMNDVLSAVKFIADGVNDSKYKIKMVVLDYLQRIRPDSTDGSTKREQMMEAVNKAKDLAIQMGCPVVLGVQAGRQVLDRDFKLPRLEDGLETSNIEQSSDKVISLWYPIKTEREGTDLSGDGWEAPVTKNLLIAGILKQKMGIAPITIPLFVRPDKNVIVGLETRYEAS
jgi:replicative DNA helicase